MDRQLACAAAALLFSAPVPAHQGQHDAAGSGGPSPTSSTVSSPKAKAARLFFSDRRLTTQHGKEVAFYSDVLSDRVVLINFVFTGCRDSCSTQSAKLAVVQSGLDELGKTKIHLVSISVDPERDTPEELRKYAAQFDAGNKWTFLTGSKENVDEVVRRLGQFTGNPESHTTLFILGNVRTGHWIKLHPDASPATIAEHLRRLAAENSGEPRNGAE